MKVKCISIIMCLLFIAPAAFAGKPGPPIAVPRPEANCDSPSSAPMDGYMIIRNAEDYCAYWSDCGNDPVDCDPNIVNWKNKVLLILYDDNTHFACAHWDHNIDSISKSKGKYIVEASYSSADDVDFPCCLACSCGLGAPTTQGFAFEVTRKVRKRKVILNWTPYKSPLGCCDCP